MKGVARSLSIHSFGCSNLFRKGRLRGWNARRGAHESFSTLHRCVYIFERTGQDWLRAWKVIARSEIPRHGCYAICPYTWPRCSPSCWRVRSRRERPVFVNHFASVAALPLDKNEIVYIVVKINRVLEIIRAVVRMPIKSYKRNWPAYNWTGYWTKIEKHLAGYYVENVLYISLAGEMNSLVFRDLDRVLLAYKCTLKVIW